MIEQRKSQRFCLKLPFELTRTGAASPTQLGETKNISSNGVLLHADTQVTAGEPVEYVITLWNGGESSQVRIRCLGKIVRSSGWEIAATLERYEFVRDQNRLLQ